MPSKPSQPSASRPLHTGGVEGWQRQSEEVFYTRDGIVTADSSAIERLSREAELARRRRARLCAHLTPDDPLHEMFIVHRAGTYVRPHRHPGRTESFHIVDGLMDVAIFDEAGQIVRSIAMGPFASGHVFYCRLNDTTFHSFVFRSPQVVFQETTSGPFDRSNTEFAPWAPREDDEAAAQYFSWLQTSIGINV